MATLLSSARPRRYHDDGFSCGNATVVSGLLARVFHERLEFLEKIPQGIYLGIYL